MKLAWDQVRDENAGFLFTLSDSIRIAAEQRPEFLHRLHDSPMVIASDYSGQHKGATHEAYSFLLTTERDLRDWLPSRDEFRKRWLRDGRRMSFKQLGEPVRARALPAFLETVADLRCNLITFLVDQKIGSLGGEDLKGIFSDCFSPETPRGTAEKMFRLAAFLSIVATGLRQEDQRSFWVSDHDETLATHQRREQLGRLASYMTYACARWANPAENVFGTTESPDSPEWAEDLASIADILAGTYCTLSSQLPANKNQERWTHVMSTAAVSDERALVIGGWMAANKGAARSILARRELDSSGEPRASAQFFLGTRPRT